MRKKLILVFTALLMVVLIAGCSSKIEDELVTLQNDMKENVGDSMADVADEFEQKGIEVENGDISPDEFLTYYDEEVQPVIDEKRKYIADYEAPTTDEAKEYHAVLTDGMILALDVIEDSAGLMIALLDDSISEEDFFEKGDELEQVVDELEAKDEEILSLQKELEDQYNVEFEDIDLE